MSTCPIAASAAGTNASTSALSEVAGQHVNAIAELGGEGVEHPRRVPEIATVAPARASPARCRRCRRSRR
jgi:hypothetical protein